jgi:hypothetical protein
VPDDRSFVWPAGRIIQVTGAARRPSWAHFAWRVLAETALTASGDLYAEAVVHVRGVEWQFANSDIRSRPT